MLIKHPQGAFFMPTRGLNEDKSLIRRATQCKKL